MQSALRRRHRTMTEADCGTINVCARIVLTPIDNNATETARETLIRQRQPKVTKPSTGTPRRASRTDGLAGGRAGDRGSTHVIVTTELRIFLRQSNERFNVAFKSAEARQMCMQPIVNIANFAKWQCTYN